MTPLAKHCLALLPSFVCAAVGALLVWTGARVVDLSLWLERRYPRP